MEAQAPATEPECLRAGSAQHRKAAGVEMVVRWGSARPLALVATLYISRAISHPPPDPPDALNQLFQPYGLPSLPSSPHSLRLPLG